MDDLDVTEAGCLSDLESAPNHFFLLFDAASGKLDCSENEICNDVAYLWLQVVANATFDQFKSAFKFEMKLKTESDLGTVPLSMPGAMGQAGRFLPPVKMQKYVTCHSLIEKLENLMLLGMVIFANCKNAKVRVIL